MPFIISLRPCYKEVSFRHFNHFLISKYSFIFSFCFFVNSVHYNADHSNPVSHMGDSPFFANYKVLIPVCLSIFAMAGFVAIVFIMRRRKLINQSRLTSSSMSDSPSTTNLQNKQNRDQQYHAVRCQSNRNSNSNDSGSYKAEGNGMWQSFETTLYRFECVHQQTFY